MKKFLVMIVLAISAINANAQVTWNVRGGLGIHCNESIYYGWCDGSYCSEGLGILVQANIPFVRGGSFTFSPSLNMSGMETGLYAFPLNIGYKVNIGQRKLFYPKLGLMFGYTSGCECSEVAYGPSFDLAFELKHFVVGLTGGVNLGTDECMAGSHIFITAGYKF